MDDNVYQMAAATHSYQVIFIRSYKSHSALLTDTFILLCQIFTSLCHCIIQGKCLNMDDEKNGGGFVVIQKFVLTWKIFAVF